MKRSWILVLIAILSSCSYIEVIEDPTDAINQFTEPSKIPTELGVLRTSTSTLTMPPPTKMPTPAATQPLPTIPPPTKMPTPAATQPPTLSPPTKMPTGTPTQIGEKWNACPGADYYSRLQIGSIAFVAYDPPLKNNVRAEPGLYKNLVGQIEPGERIEIIKGPGCVNNLVWWRIRSLESGLVGWTAEGDDEGYWLVPEGLKE